MKTDVLKKVIIVANGIILLASVVLEALPFGVKMNICYCGSPTPYHWLPYFSPIPYSWGTYFPLIIAVLSSISLVIYAINFLVKKNGMTYAILTLQGIIIGFSIYHLCTAQITAISVILPVLSIIYIVFNIIHLVFLKKNAKTSSQLV